MKRPIITPPGEDIGAGERVAEPRAVATMRGRVAQPLLLPNATHLARRARLAAVDAFHHLVDLDLVIASATERSCSGVGFGGVGYLACCGLAPMCSE